MGRGISLWCVARACARACADREQLVELKNGETFNGHLIACDNFMNITLRDVYQTSAVRMRARACACADRPERGAVLEAARVLHPWQYGTLTEMRNAHSPARSSTAASPTR